MKKTTLLFCLSFFLISSVSADELNDVDRLIRKMVDQVLTHIRNPELAGEEKKDKIMEVVTPVFDFNLMAKLSLGRQHWPKLSKDERSEFTDLFIQQLQSSYLENVEMVADEKVEFDKPAWKGEKVLGLEQRTSHRKNHRGY